MSGRGRSQDPPRETNNASTGAPKRTDSEQLPLEELQRLLITPPRETIRYDTTPRSASHSPSSRDPATGSLDEPSVDFPPVQRLAPPSWIRDSWPDPEEGPSNRRRKTTLIPHKPREVVVFDSTSPTKTLQLDHRVLRRSLARSSVNGWATRAFKEYALNVHELRGWHVSRSGQWMASRRRTSSDTTDNLVRYGPYIATSRFLATRKGRRVSLPGPERRTVSSQTPSPRSILRNRSIPRIAYTMDDVFAERRRLRSLGHDMRHGRTIRGMYENPRYVSRESLNSSTHTRSDDARSSRSSYNETHATVRMMVSVGQSFRKWRKWVFRRSVSSPSELPPSMDLTDTVVNRSMSQAAEAHGLQVDQEQGPLIPPRNPRRLSQLQTSGEGGSSVQSDEPVSPRTILRDEDPIYSTPGAAILAAGRASLQSTPPQPQTGIDENAHPFLISRPLELCQRPQAGSASPGPLAANGNQQASATNLPVRDEDQSAAIAGVQDSRNPSSSDPQRTYVGKGKGRARDFDGGPQIFSVVHTLHPGQTVSFMQTVDDDIVRAVMAESLKEWHEQRQRDQQAASGVEVHHSDHPPIPVVKSVFDCWREGLDPFLETRPHNVVFKQPKQLKPSQTTDFKSSLDVAQPTGTLRRCWDALKETVDALAAVWDGDEHDESPGLAASDDSGGLELSHRPQSVSTSRCRSGSNERRSKSASTTRQDPSSALETSPSRPQRPLTIPPSTHFESLNASPLTSRSSKRRRKRKAKHLSPTPVRSRQKSGIDHTYSTDDDHGSHSLLNKILYQEPLHAENDQICVFMCSDDNPRSPGTKDKSQSNDDAQGTTQEQKVEQNEKISDTTQSKGKFVLPSEDLEDPLLSFPPAALTNALQSHSGAAAMPPVATGAARLETSVPYEGCSIGYLVESDSQDSGPHLNEIMEGDFRNLDVSTRLKYDRINNRTPSPCGRSIPDFSHPRVMKKLEAVAKEQRENERRASVPYKLRFTAGRQRHEHTRYFPANPFPRKRYRWTWTSSPREEPSHEVTEPEPVAWVRSVREKSQSPPVDTAQQETRRRIPTWIDDVEAARPTTLEEVERVTQQIRRHSLDGTVPPNGIDEELQGPDYQQNTRKTRSSRRLALYVIMSAAAPSEGDTLHHLCPPFRPIRRSTNQTDELCDFHRETSDDQLFLTFGVDFKAFINGGADDGAMPPTSESDNILFSMANILPEADRPDHRLSFNRVVIGEGATITDPESFRRACTPTWASQSGQSTHIRRALADKILCTIAGIPFKTASIAHGSGFRGEVSRGKRARLIAGAKGLEGNEGCSLDYERELLAWTPSYLQRKTVSWQTFVDIAGLPPFLVDGPISPSSDLTHVLGFLYDLDCVHHGASDDQNVLEARYALHTQLLSNRLQNLCKCA